MSKGTSVIIIVVALVLLVLGLWYFSAAVPSPYANLPQFASCIANSKATMYGAYWCPHCQNEKARFGTSFKFVPYVECTQEVAKCTAANVTVYPTWIFGDGHRVEGDLPLEQLAKETGCSLEPSK